MSIDDDNTLGAAQRNLLASASFEVTPTSWRKFRSTHPQRAASIHAGTRVFIAHIAGTPLDEMVATSRELRMLGLEPVPHVPARLVRDQDQLRAMLSAYRTEADVVAALVIAGGVKNPSGDFVSSMDLVATGLFDQLGFTGIFFAGHPEGSRDIDPDGSTTQADAALRWKTDWRNRSGMSAALLTQFLFASAPLLAWAGRQRRDGIDLPIHVGLAGPTHLAELVRYGISCGVGPSLALLQRRALDIRKLMRPIVPDDLVAELAAGVDQVGNPLVAGVHVFPFGGLAGFLDWQANTAAAVKQRRQDFPTASGTAP